MSTIGTARNACAASDGFLYQRRRPEKTLLYQLVSKHYPVFRQQLAEEGRILPGYVQREFEDYLKCGRLEHGFLRVRCEKCHEERLVAFSCKRRGFCPSCGGDALRARYGDTHFVNDMNPVQGVCPVEGVCHRGQGVCPVGVERGRPSKFGQFPVTLKKCGAVRSID